MPRYPHRSGTPQYLQSLTENRIARCAVINSRRTQSCARPTDFRLWLAFSRRASAMRGPPNFNHTFAQVGTSAYPTAAAVEEAPADPQAEGMAEPPASSAALGRG